MQAIKEEKDNNGKGIKIEIQKFSTPQQQYDDDIQKFKTIEPIDSNQSNDHKFYDSLDDKLYEKALKTIQKDMKTHLLLKQSVNSQHIVIGQLAFRDKRAFMYVMRKMKQLNSSIRKVSFKDIVTLKKNIFFTLCQQMREIHNLEEVYIVNANVTGLQVIQLQQLLCWMQKQIKVLVISGANLIDEHIDILFFQKFRITDFYQLEKLELKNCPQLWKSDKYMMLMKQYAKLKYYQVNYLSLAHQKTLQSNKNKDEKTSQNKEVKEQLLQPPIKSFSIAENQKQIQKKESFKSIQNEKQVQQQKNLSFHQQDKTTEAHGLAVPIQNNNSDTMTIQMSENQNDQIPNINQIKTNIIDAGDTICGSIHVHQSGKPLLSFLQSEEAQNSKSSSFNIKKFDTFQNDYVKEKIKEDPQKVIFLNKLPMQFLKERRSNKLNNQEELFEDQTYDNRHSRQLLVGQWDQEKEKDDRKEHNFWENIIYFKQQGLNEDSSEENESINNLMASQQQKLLKSSIGLLGKSSSQDQVQGKNIYDLNKQEINKDKTNGNSNSSSTHQDQQFFAQFFKQCVRELMDIDMCQVIDLSQMSWQSMRLEEKRQMCQYVSESNSIQTLIIKYDRFFCKELCEQISNKYKLKKSKFQNLPKRSRMNSAFINSNYTNIKSDNQGDTTPKESINLETNLLSLENIKILSSKQEQFQADSFCYLILFAIFLQSIEVDFLNLQIEEQILFPTKQQLLTYLLPLLETGIEEEDNERILLKRDALDRNSFFKTNQATQNIEKEQINQKQEEKLFKNSQEAQGEYSYSRFRKKQNQSSEKQQQDESQTYESIREFKDYLELNTSIKELSLRNFCWQNAQSQSKEKSFSQFLFQFFSFTADSLVSLDWDNVTLSHSCLQRLQIILKKVENLYLIERQKLFEAFKKVNQWDVIKMNQIPLQFRISKSLKTDLNKNQRDQVSKENNLFGFKDGNQLLNDEEKKSNLSLKLRSKSRNQRTKSQIIGSPLVGSSQEKKQNSNTSLEKPNQPNQKRTHFLENNQLHNSRSEKKIEDKEKTLLNLGHLNRHNQKQKSFLLKFRIKFAEKRLFKVQNVLNSFSCLCKSVEVINASNIDLSELRSMEQPNPFFNKNNTNLHNNSHNLDQQQVTGGISRLNQIKNRQTSSSRSSFFGSQQLLLNQEDLNNLKPVVLTKKRPLGVLRLIDYPGITQQEIYLIRHHSEDLQELSLIRCSLSLSSLSRIVSHLSLLRNLKYLAISGNDLSFRPQVQQQTEKKIIGILGLLSKKQSNSKILQKDMLESQTSSHIIPNSQQKQQERNSSLGQFSHNQKKKTTKNVFILDSIEEEIDQTLNSDEDIFQFCLKKIFSMSSLKHLILSNNNLNEAQGKLIQQEIESRAQLLLRYKQQQIQRLNKHGTLISNNLEIATFNTAQNASQIQQNQNPNQMNLLYHNTSQSQITVISPFPPSKQDSLKINIQLNTGSEGGVLSHSDKDNNSPILPNNQDIPTLKSGFYSEFIENQISSNLRQDHQKDFFKTSSKSQNFRSLQNRFFTRDINSDDDDDHDDESSNQNKSKSNSLNSSISESSCSSHSQQQQKQGSIIQDNNNNEFLQNWHNFKNNPSNNDNYKDQKDEETEKKSQQTQTQLKYNPHSGELLTQKSVSNIDRQSSDLSNIPLQKRKSKKNRRSASELISMFREKVWEIVEQKRRLNNQLFGKGNTDKGVNNKQQKQKPKFNTNYKMKVKKEDLDTPNLLEFDISSNLISSSSLLNISKYFPVLFTDIRVIDISSQKPPKLSKVEKDLQGIAFARNETTELSNFQEVSSGESESQEQFSFKEKYDKKNEDKVNVQSEDAQEEYMNLLNHENDQLEQLQKVGIRFLPLSSFINKEKNKISSLFKNLFVFPKLTELDISGSLNRDQDAIQLMNLIQSQSETAKICSNLKKLILSACQGLKKEIWNELILCILCNFPHLYHLSLKDCQLNNERMFGILDAFQQLPWDSELSSLCLAKNPKLQTCLKEIIFRLTQIQQIKLQVLDLSDCELNDESCEGMIQGLLAGKKKRISKIDAMLQEDINGFSSNKQLGQLIQGSEKEREENFSHQIEILGEKSPLNNKNKHINFNQHSRTSSFLPLINEEKQESNLMDGMTSILHQGYSPSHLQHKTQGITKNHQISTLRLQDQMASFRTLNMTQRIQLIKDIDLVNQGKEERNQLKQQIILQENLEMNSVQYNSDERRRTEGNTNTGRRNSIDKLIAKTKEIEEQQKNKVDIKIQKTFYPDERSKDSENRYQFKMNTLQKKKTKFEQRQQFQQGFSLIRLHMHDNRNISMKMNLLTQYCFVFQLSDEDNILLTLQFTSDSGQKKQLQNIIKQLHAKKEAVYRHLFDSQLQERSVSATSLELGPNLFGNRKTAEDIIINSLLTFNELSTLKLFVNDKVATILQMIHRQKQVDIKQTTLIAQQLFVIKNIDSEKLMQEPQKLEDNTIDQQSTQIGRETTIKKEEEKEKKIQKEEENNILLDSQIIQTPLSEEEMNNEDQQYQSQDIQFPFTTNIQSQINSQLKPNTSNYLPSIIHHLPKIPTSIASNRLASSSSSGGSHSSNVYWIKDQTTGSRKLTFIPRSNKLSSEKASLSYSSRKLLAQKEKKNQESETLLKEPITESSIPEEYHQYFLPRPQKFQIFSEKGNNLYHFNDENYYQNTLIPKKPSLRKKNTNQKNSKKKKITILEGIIEQEKKQDNHVQQNSAFISSQSKWTFKKKPSKLVQNNFTIHLNKINKLELSSSQQFELLPLLEFFSLISPQLKILDLSKVQMTPTSFFKIISALPTLFQFLESISFQNIYFKDFVILIPQTAQFLADTMTNPNIKSVSLINCDLSAEFIQILKYYTTIKRFTTERIDFSQNQNISFEEVGSKQIFDSVKALKLSNCNLNLKKFSLDFRKWEKQYLDQLEILDLSYNKGFSGKFFQNLGEFVSRKKQLKYLDISYTAFYEEKQKWFSFGVQRGEAKNSVLQHLRVREMQFTKREGTLKFFQTLSSMKNLVNLDFGEMKMSNWELLDLFQFYLQISSIGKLNKVEKVSFKNCSFLFEGSPIVSQNEFKPVEAEVKKEKILIQKDIQADLPSQGSKIQKINESIAINITDNKSNINSLPINKVTQIQNSKNGITSNNTLQPLGLNNQMINSNNQNFADATHLQSPKNNNIQASEILLQIKTIQQVDLQNNNQKSNSDLDKSFSDSQQFLFQENEKNENEIVLDYCQSEEIHSSIFLLTQWNNLQNLDLSNCLNTKKSAHYFTMGILSMKKKKLVNYQLKSLNLSFNLIPASSINEVLSSILYLFRNLISLDFRSLVRYDSTYVLNLLASLGNFAYFSEQQNQSQINKTKNEKDKELSSILKSIKTFRKEKEIINDGGVQFEDERENKQSKSEKLMNQMQFDVPALSLEEFYLSDIQSDLINNKEAIDSLLFIIIASKLFPSLKKILIQEEILTSSSSYRFQSAYSESLLELNDLLDMSVISPELNRQTRIVFKFKNSNSLLSLKTQVTPLIQDEKKPLPKLTLNRGLSSAVFTNKNTLNSNRTDMFQDNNFSSNLKRSTLTLKNLISNQYSNSKDKNENNNSSDFEPIKVQKGNYFKFSGMRAEYQQESNEQENEWDPLLMNNQDSSNIESSTNNCYLTINEENEHLFAPPQSEAEEHQIQLWRTFQPFISKLYKNSNNDYNMSKQTHIILNYSNPNLKLLSSNYNLFLDNKQEFNSNLQTILTNTPSLYLGNPLYHFLVQECSFKPQTDLIDFLIRYLIFAASQSNKQLVSKNIRLPPFLILSEEDAQRIQRAFVEVKNAAILCKKSNFAFQKYKTKDGLNDKQRKNGILFESQIFSSHKSINKLDSQKSTFQNSNILPIMRSVGSMNPKSTQKSKIICNYFYKSTGFVEEYDEIAKLKKMPPSTLSIDNFSINGLKAVYIICYQNDYFMKSDIDFESLMFVSTSLAFSLREFFYREYISQKQQFFKSILYRIMYYFMDIFVDVDSYFKYDESMVALDEMLLKSNKSINFFRLMIGTKSFICYFMTPLFSLMVIGPQGNDGLSDIMYYSYLFYALISFIFEIYFLRKLLKLTNHLIPDIALVHQDSAISRVRDFFFEKIMNTQLFDYKNFIFYQKTIFSFLTQLDQYQDVCFVIVAIEKEQYLIACLAIMVTLINKLIDIKLFKEIQNKSSYSNLFFRHINKIYEYATQGHLEALSNLLDVINPHNVLKITPNLFTNLFLPKKFIGLTINKQIFYRVKKVMGSDIPQVLLQLIFTFQIITQNSSTVNLSIALNFVSILKSLLVILTIKQSVLSQMDFDELSEQKAEYLQSQFLQYKEKEIEMFQEINTSINELQQNNTLTEMANQQEAQITNNQEKLNNVSEPL